MQPTEQTRARRLLTQAEAAKILGIQPDTLRLHASLGKIAAVLIPRRNQAYPWRYYERDEVLKYQKARQVKTRRGI